MALRGSVRAFSLDQLLNFLSASGHRGTLAIFHGDAHKTLYLHQGGLYFERSNWSFRLGDALVRRAELSHEQLETAIAEQTKGGGKERLGEVLVRLGYVTAERILAARRYQVEEEIYELFGWEDAFFEFSKDKLPPEFEARLVARDPEEFRFEVTSVLMEAARRLDEWHNIRDTLPSEKRLLVLSDREGAWERATTGLVGAGSRVSTPDGVFGGKTTVAELPRALGLSRFEAQSLATRLMQQGDVRPLQRHELETRFRTALESDLPYAVTLYECALETPEFEPRGRFLDRVLFGCSQFREKAPGGVSITARVSGKRAFEILLALFRQGISCEYGAREEDRNHVLALGKSALVWRVGEGRQPPNILKHLLLKNPIAEAELTRVREQQRDSGRSMQAILVGGGFVTMDTWLRAQKDALLEELFGIFFLRRPHVEVKTGAGARPASPGLDIEVPLVPWLHAEVMREIRQWETMLGIIPSVRAIFTLTPKGEKSIVGPEDTLRQFDGQRSLEEIMKGQTRAPPEFFAWVYERVEGGRLKALEPAEYSRRLDEAIEQKQRAEAVAVCVAAIESCADSAPFRERLKTLQSAEAEISVQPTQHTLRGDLASFSLPEVLQSLNMSKRSGTLRVELKTNVEVKARQIYFDRGDVYLLAGGHAELADDDLVDDLIVGGNLTEDQIASAAAAQMKDEVYEIFVWENAEFEFAADHHPREFTQASSRRRVKLNSRGFLLEAVRRIAEWEEVRRILPSDDVVLEFASAEAKREAINAKGEMKDLLLLVDGRHPIPDLVRISGVHRFKGVAVLAELVAAGLLRKVDLSKRAAEDENAIAATNLPTSGVIEPGFVGQLQFVGTLQDLASAGLTGVLRLTDGRRSKEMALIEGVPHRTQPYRPRDPKLAEQNGTALVAESTKDLAEDVSECFSWQGTRFELLVGTLPPRLADPKTRGPMRLDPDPFFDTFAQAGERWGLVAELVPRDKPINYTSDESREAARNKAGDEPKLVDLVDGKRTAEEVARLSGRRFAAMSFIAACFEDGLIEAVDPQEQEGGEDWDLNL